MIKVIKCEFDHMTEIYVMDLENGDRVLVSERNYDRIMLHESVQGNVYRAIVDEHEDEFEETVEYLGFELTE